VGLVALSARSDAPMAVISLLSLGAMAALYFAPTINAVQRGHPNTAPIAVVNLFFGWTLIGWVIVLAWSYSAIKRE